MMKQNLATTLAGSQVLNLISFIISFHYLISPHKNSVHLQKPWVSSP